MANLINRVGELKKEKKRKKGLPDLEFIYNDTNYILESTTKCPTLMGDYARLLPDFDNYFKLASFFYEKNEQLKGKESGWNYDWYNMIEQIWYHCNAEEKNAANHLVSKCKLPNVEKFNLDEIIQLLKKWIFINWYACFHFNDLVVVDYLKKMESISIPKKNEFVTYFPPENTKVLLEFQNCIVERIAEAIIEKLQKPYCETNDHIILAVSIAEYPRLISPSVFFDSGLLKANLCSSLQSSLQTQLEKYRDNGKNEKYQENKRNMVIDNIKKLYAVLIDTSWYNWLPNIAKVRGGAIFNNTQHENCYGIIYNTNFSSVKDKSSHAKVCDKLIHKNYTLELPLVI